MKIKTSIAFSIVIKNVIKNDVVKTSTLKAYLQRKITLLKIIIFITRFLRREEI